MLKKVSKNIWFGLLLLVLGMAMVWLINLFYKEYPLLDAKKMEVTVVDRGIQKNNYLPYSYFVIVEQAGEEKSSVKDARHHYVSKRQIKQLDNGDTITGFTTDGQTFHTLRDVVYDSLIIVLFLTILLIVLLALIYSKMKDIKQVKKLLDPLKERVERHTVDRPRFVQYFIGAMLIPLICLLLLSAVHHVMEFVPIGQKETAALIVDKEYERGSGAGRAVTNSHHYLTLQYIVNDQRQFAILDVPRKRFNNVDELETIPITYRDVNTHNVFIKAPVMEKVLNIVISERMFYIGLMIFLLYVLTELYIKEVRNHKKKKRK